MGIEATGGTITQVDDGGITYKVHTFTSSGTFEVTEGSGNVDILIVGGGGGGGKPSSGSTHGPGGGGAGGLIFEKGYNIIGPLSETVTIGAGGTSVGNVNTSSQQTGENGEDSSIFDLIALGGGGGSNRGLNESAIGNTGADGGSGGGNANDSSGIAIPEGLQPGSTSGGYGEDGGQFTRAILGSSYRIGGGGGGAGETGDSAAPNGGDGLKEVIIGETTYNFASLFGTHFGVDEDSDGNAWLCGGGGGGRSSSYGGSSAGGKGGGGAGITTNGEDGVANTGGGGAGGQASTGGSGGTGGSGIVIIRYATSAEETHLEDISLNLSAYYQAIENLASFLRAHDGLELRDLKTFLEAHDGTELRDLSAMLWAVGADEVFAHISAITGAGSPNYLDNPLYIKVVNDHAFVTSYNAGYLMVFDVSDINNPVAVGQIGGAGAPNYMQAPFGLDIAGDYAYVTSSPDHSFSVIDISDPTNPTHVTTLQPESGQSWHHPQHISVQGDYAYVYGVNNLPTENCITIFDISDPENPTYKSHVQTDGGDAFDYLYGCHGIKAVGNYVYAVASNYYVHSFIVVDVTDKDNPAIAAVLTGDGSPNYLGGASGLAISGDYAFVASSADDALTIFDISDPTNPTHAAVISGVGAPNFLGGATTVAVEGDHAFVVGGVAPYYAALTVFDVSDPENPIHQDVIVGKDAPTYLYITRQIAVCGGVAYVISGSSEAWVGALSLFNVSKYTGVSAYQKFDYMRMVLEVLAVDPSEFRDLVMNLEAWGVQIDNFKALLEAAKDKYKNLTMLLEATDGTLLNNLTMLLEATDGTVFNNFVLQLQCIAATPVFRSVTAQRVSSVVHEVV